MITWKLYSSTTYAQLGQFFVENRNGRKLFATLLPDAIFNVEQFYDVEEFFHLQTQGGAIQFLRSSAKQKTLWKKHKAMK